MSLGDREVCIERLSRFCTMLLLVVREVEFRHFGQSRGECDVRNGPALVLLGGEQRHVAFVAKLIKN